MSVWECDSDEQGKEQQGFPLLSRLVLAASFKERVQGLLLASPHKETMMLLPCSDVHTVGMRHALDVAFVDCDGLVLETYRAVRPLSRLRNKNARVVLERFSSDTPWFQAGDRLGIGHLAEEGIEECVRSVTYCRKGEE